jgi:signal transduction histidine kinase
MFHRMRATQRLVGIFTITILVPGVILAFFGLRALRQERAVAEQQIRERLNGAAETAGRRLELEFKEWQLAADRLAQSDPANRDAWPSQLRAASEQTGVAVVLYRNGNRIESLPPGQLSYELSDEIGVHADSPAPLLAQAESLELREKKYDEAIASYRRLLAAETSGGRAPVLHGLGRTLKKAGHNEEAIRTFRLLEQEPAVRIASLPSDLIALYEITGLETGPTRSRDALRLYQDLVHGRWRLQKSSYIFYSEQSREWITESAASHDVGVLIGDEQKKLRLSSFAEQLVESPRSFASDGGAAYVAFWHAEPFVAILLGEPFLRSTVLPNVNSTEFEVALLSSDGVPLVKSAPAEHEPLAAYTLQTASMPLRVHVWAKDPAALYATISRQQNLYLGMLAVVVALLGFGGYLTARTLKSELAVAQMKSDFVSTVSHEFRSPLAGINQLGEMLRDGRVHDDVRRQQYYEMIVAETQRLRRLVENVLDFARMEDGRKQYRFEPVESVQWLREVAEDFGAEVARAGFAINAEIPEELPAIVADRETLTTAVHNLLDNAVKYSGNSNVVRLRANADREALSISVKDEGVGIREEDQPRIFEKFFRGGGEIARQVKGVGLGLNLVQHIVAAHGGSVTFDSTEGKGSTFTIRLKTARNPA